MCVSWRGYVGVCVVERVRRCVSWRGYVGVCVLVRVRRCCVLVRYVCPGNVCASW